MGFELFLRPYGGVDFLLELESIELGQNAVPKNKEGFHGSLMVELFRQDLQHYAEPAEADEGATVFELVQIEPPHDKRENLMQGAIK